MANNELKTLPLLPLRGITVFPYMVLHFDVTRTKSVLALEEAMVGNQMIFLVTQKDVQTEEPGHEDLYSVGTISRVKQLLKLPGDNIRVLVEGVQRAKIKKYEQKEPFFICTVETDEEEQTSESNLKAHALIRMVNEAFEQYFALNPKIAPDALSSIKNLTDCGRIADLIASNILISTDAKQEILDEFNGLARLEKLIVILKKEISLLEIEQKIASKVKEQIDKNQKEYYLREQLKAIQVELGANEDVFSEVEDMKAELLKMHIPKEAESKVLKELDRLVKMPYGTPEGSIIRTYVDTIMSLPWNKETLDNLSLDNAQKVLDEDHYGLEKVKERIIEFLAVKQFSQNLKGSILCLVGPPGVGKTSIAKSIARALNRKYVRMSLGGVRDEAEIRGHRKTYVGAMPGRIISSIKLAGTKNPLILLDEIDKMGSDFRGDPASAMLEVLDSEQNFAFRDHYLEVPFDLSDVMFLTTANSLETIPRPLLDRMEIIELSSYTAEEKFYIAKNYLVKKQAAENGLTTSQVKFHDAAIRDIITYYTRESGVRGLERQIANICRKSAKQLIEKNKKSISITSKMVEKMLGTRRYRHEAMGNKDEIGIATGLAWTSVGGETMGIEVNVMDGSGKVELTGQLGDVMKESAMAAISFIRSRAHEFDIRPDFHKKLDIHIHVPEGAIPKDGPSAGITMATALISALSGYPVLKNVAMTGEITLRGRVLPIGGLKEKSLAAYRAGITKIIIPQDNKRDLDEIPDTVKDAVRFVLADSMDTVLKHALVRSKAKRIPPVISEDSQSPELYEQMHTQDLSIGLKQ